MRSSDRLLSLPARGTRRGAAFARAAAAAAVLCLFALTGASARDLPTGPSLDAVQAAPLAGAGQAAPSVEDYAALLASVAMAKEKKPAAARAALDAVFATARQNLADLAAHDVFGGDSLKHALNPNSLLETPLAQHALNFTDQVGTYLASLLPDHLGPFPINHSYIQNVNLGAVLSAVGINYAPCYFSSTPVGAFVGSTGIFIAPSILNNFDVGVSAVSEALTIFPTLVTVGPTDTQIEAIGGLVAPTLVSITPVREVHLRSGLSGTPVDVAVVLAPPNSTAAPAGSADTTAENDSAAGVTPRRGLLK